MISPAKRRQVVVKVIDRLHISQRGACQIIGQPVIRDDEDGSTGRIIQLASRFGRYGYRRITALLRMEGWRVNHKRVARIWRQEGLKVPPKQPKRGGL